MAVNQESEALPGADLRVLPGLLDGPAQAACLTAVREIVAAAPLYRPNPIWE